MGIFGEGVGEKERGRKQGRGREGGEGGERERGEIEGISLNELLGMKKLAVRLAIQVHIQYLGTRQNDTP